MYTTPTRVERVEKWSNGYGWSIVQLGRDVYEVAVLSRGIMMDSNPVFAGDVYRGDWDQVNDIVDRICDLPKETWA